MADDQLANATGLALATIAALIERPQPIPRGELARLLTILAETAENPGQQHILQNWASLVGNIQVANDS